MASRREPTHVRPDFSHDNLGHDVTDAWHGLQEPGGPGKRDHDLAKAAFDIRHCPLQTLDLSEVKSEQEPMVIPDIPSQSFDQSRVLLLEQTLSEIGQPFRVLLPGGQGTEDCAAAESQQIADQTGDLDVGVLEHLLDPQRVLGHLAHQLLARTG